MIKQKVLKNIFVGYMIFLVYVMVIYQRHLDFSWIVTGGLQRLNFLMSDTTNFQLFATVNRYLGILDRPSGFGLFLYNIVGNMMILIPLGYLFPMVNKRVKKWWVFMVVALVFILLIEMMQFFSMSGTLDIDDVMLNMMGAMIGYLLCPSRALVKKKQRVE